MKTIETLRKEIDIIDDEIIRLLDNRFDISLLIGRAKQICGGSILDKSREEQILNKINNQAKHNDSIKDIYKFIMEKSRELQKKLKE